LYYTHPGYNVFSGTLNLAPSVYTPATGPLFLVDVVRTIFRFLR